MLQSDSNPRWDAHLIALLGYVLRYDCNDPDRALRAYRKAVLWDPVVATLRHHWGLDFLVTMGHGKEAVAAVQEAVRLSPKNARVHLTLGRVRQQIDDLDGAIEAYLEAVRLAPKLPGAAGNEITPWIVLLPPTERIAPMVLMSNPTPRSRMMKFSWTVMLPCS